MGAKLVERIVGARREIDALIQDGRLDDVGKKLDWYFDLFGRDNFFLELQHHQIDEAQGGDGRA